MWLCLPEKENGQILTFGTWEGDLIWRAGHWRHEWVAIQSQGIKVALIQWPLPPLRGGKWGWWQDTSEHVMKRCTGGTRAEAKTHHGLPESTRSMSCRKDPSPELLWARDPNTLMWAILAQNCQGINIHHFKQTSLWSCFYSSPRKLKPPFLCAWEAGLGFCCPFGQPWYSLHSGRGSPVLQPV